MQNCECVIHTVVSPRAHSLRMHCMFQMSSESNEAVQWGQSYHCHNILDSRHYFEHNVIFSMLFPSPVCAHLSPASFLASLSRFYFDSFSCSVHRFAFFFIFPCSSTFHYTFISISIVAVVGTIELAALSVLRTNRNNER